MREIIVTVLLLCSLPVYGQDKSDWEISADKENFHVFLLMGQSNMNGGGDLQGDLPRVLFIARKDKDWSPAKRGTVRGVSLGVQFAKAYMNSAHR